MTNTTYIGQSVDAKYRRSCHFSELKRGIHLNQYLQNSWNKHGKENFVFEIIEECLDEEATLREQYWIDYYGGINSSNTFNLKEAASIGRHSALSIAKMSLSHKGHITTLETRRKISEGNKGKQIGPSKETGRKISASLMGHEVSADTRRKLSEANKGQIVSPETRKKLSEANKGRRNPGQGLGRKDSIEKRRKMSESQKERYRKKKEAEMKRYGTLDIFKFREGI